MRPAGVWRDVGGSHAYVLAALPNRTGFVKAKGNETSGGVEGCGSMLARVT